MSSTPKKVRQLTVEEIDNLLLQAPKARALKSGASKAQINLTKICEIVNKAVPILRFAKSFLWWKPKWQKIIDDVINVASMACGTPE